MTDAEEEEGEPEGYLIVYTGAGRDKTNAALGLALRAVGNGQKAIFVYFTGPSHPGLSELKVTAEIGDSWRMVGIRSEAKDLSYLTGFYVHYPQGSASGSNMNACTFKKNIIFFLSASKQDTLWSHVDNIFDKG